MNKKLAIAVLAVAVAAVGASVAWAATGTRTAWGPGAGMGYGMGSGLMPGYGTAGKGAPVSTIPAAKARAQAFADALGLSASEVMQFERNFYVKLVDAKGNDATEVLVDPATGFVSLEYGPAMMWNSKYGMMSGRTTGSLLSPGGGMMGGSMMGSASAGSRGYGGMMGSSSGAGHAGIGPVAPAQAPAGAASIAEARSYAQAWLDKNQAGVSVETSGDSFPGYFTLETLQDGKIVGMISVNATTGAVWPHWWHGAFVASAA